MTQYKEYHAVHKTGAVSVKLLRSTKNYLIEQNGTRYKKSEHTDNVDYIAEQMGAGGWCYHYRIYMLNHPFVIKKIEQQERMYFTSKVVGLIRTRGLTYDEAAKINKVLGLGVEE